MLVRLVDAIFAPKYPRGYTGRHRASGRHAADRFTGRQPGRSSRLR